ncbi:sugar-binding transcriptional regulator [Georgenia sp. EYE_87]|uniref:sugar-binding transcriptional regulator n=1 Tax=Georgenia sp. EYE_87 TaxID=2853448 RepID=UPI0020069AE2|nr:sugar-binding transcriptional regulator [Georgenia sp. EYE_87]MCK6210854.1 sugar-binding transcriptional regulator [Georgenia sp. EYE_87]
MLKRAGEEWEAEEQLLRVAWYYYVDQLTQDEIAKRLAVSRPSAGRLLERCRQSGIVSFTIGSDHFDAFKVGRKLRETFGLREALVPPALDDAEQDQSGINHRLARGGAQYLQNHLKPGEMLAMGWGETVQATVDLVAVDLMTRVSTVTLTGGVNAYVSTLRRVRGAAAEGCTDAVIPAPIVVSSPTLAEALRQEAGVREVMELSHRSDHALVGIGAVTGQATLAQLGYVNDAELARIAEAGAVGDILGIFYDEDGQVVDLPIHERRIGIGIDELRAIPNVVGVAGGIKKLAAIRGALRGGYLDVLVTNEEVARALLEAEGVDVD